jgi:hypothetical protein
MDQRRNISSKDTGTHELTPRYRQTASMFVSAWIENAPHQRHDSREGGRDIEKPRTLGRGKSSLRSGPLSAMYFGNDVILNSRHRNLRESWEPTFPLRRTISDSTKVHVSHEESEFSAGRFRPAAPSSPMPSDISLSDKSASFQRAKREACGPSQSASKSPSRTTQPHKRSTAVTHEDFPDRDVFLREREAFLRDRALFLRERELFLDEKQRFHREKDALLQKRGELTNKAAVETKTGVSKSSDTVQT